MRTAEAFVGKFLAHYASEYYDPAKAREYYLRNRELKGRQSTSELTVKGDQARSETRRQAWAYAKNQINEDKKSQIQSISEARKVAFEKARQTAQAKREEIGNKLNSLLDLLTRQKDQADEVLSANVEAAMKDVTEAFEARAREIRAAAQKKIDAIPPVPDGVRGSARERLVAVRAKKIAKINGDTDKQINTAKSQAATERASISTEADQIRTEISSQTQEEKINQRNTARADRERVSIELRASVEKARANYEAGKESLIAVFERKTQNEFDAIRTRV